MRYGFLIFGLWLLSAFGVSDTCDPALAPSCGNREDGGQVTGMRGCTWNLVTSYVTSINLCTGYTSDCGDGPCNALEEWSYEWQIWEVVKGDDVIKRSGCIRDVISRVGSGMCCDGKTTKQPIKQVVHDAPKGKTGGCGCKALPKQTCVRCH